jgi:hypothetical protein
MAVTEPVFEIVMLSPVCKVQGAAFSVVMLAGQVAIAALAAKPQQARATARAIGDRRRAVVFILFPGFIGLRRDKPFETDGEDDI